MVPKGGTLWKQPSMLSSKMKGLLDSSFVKSGPFNVRSVVWRISHCEIRATFVPQKALTKNDRDHENNLSKKTGTGNMYRKFKNQMAHSSCPSSFPF